MTLSTLYNDLIDRIIVELKTISELTGTPNQSKVYKWKPVRRNPTQGDTEAVVMAGPMQPIEGFTTHSSNNEFVIIVDIIHWSKTMEAGFSNAMGVAEKIYDQFHLTNINSLVRIAKVAIFPGDGELSSENLLAIPIRITITCEKVITQI